MSKVSEIYETMEYGPAPESAERALEWIDSHGGVFGHWIAGDWDSGTDGETFEVQRPSDASLLARVTQGSDADVDRAVSAAREALPAWKALAPHERARHLYAIARGLQRKARLFAVLESLDNGKPVRESRDLDIPLVARHFYHHAGWAQLMDHEPELADMEGVGVVGQVIPWNFPLLMLAWKVAPALAAGCTVVLKPAEYTPLTALCFAELADEVGLPPGVLNIVTGDGRTGAALVAHEGVDKVAFTGSTEVGRIIRTAIAGSGKRLSLELGGKSPFVVFDDADLDSVVEGVVDAIWFNQGQVCCAGSRILVHEGVADRLVEKLRARMERLRMGDPLDKGIDMGAIVAPVQLERIRELVARGEDEGATIWQPSWAAPREGWFYPPTLCTDVAPASTLAQVEIFGPVVALLTFRTPDEAVELANDTRYGLAASVWTENVNLALDVAPAIKAGTVWVNCTNLFDAAAGFGGYRESGYGREGGIEGLREYLRPEWEFVAQLRDEAEETALIATPRASSDAPPTSAVDRTAKHYIGGRQVRPDAEYTLPVRDRSGTLLAEVPRGNRKDVRNAVEAARKAQGAWARRTAHNRAQILYFLAENMDLRADELTRRLLGWHGGEASARAEVDATVQRLFTYAAWADKWDGRVHHTPFRNVTLAMPEPLGIVGAVAPAEAPLLGLVSVMAPLIAMGNATVILPSPGFPLAAIDLTQLLETSDVPGGVVNLITGLREEVVPTLAAHDGVDGLWVFGPRSLCAEVERLSTGNMKRLWCSQGRVRDWMNPARGEGPEFLHEATQIKNIWVPYGE
jgi:aldehyde dehydrogenase (NAD+)